MLKPLDKHLIQLVAIAKSWAMGHVAGFDDASHRQILARHGAQPKQAGGEPSATTLGISQLNAVLDTYVSLGWERRHGQGAANKPRLVIKADMALLLKLWSRLATADKVHNNERSALLAWISREMGREVKRLDDLTVIERQRLIEQQKQWLAR